MLEAGLGLGWGHSGPRAILLQEGDFEPRGREGVHPAPPSPQLAWRPCCALRTAPLPSLACLGTTVTSDFQCGVFYGQRKPEPASPWCDSRRSPTCGCVSSTTRHAGWDLMIPLRHQQRSGLGVRPTSRVSQGGPGELSSREAQLHSLSARGASLPGTRGRLAPCLQAPWTASLCFCSGAARLR